MLMLFVMWTYPLDLENKTKIIWFGNELIFNRLLEESQQDFQASSGLGWTWT